MSNYNVFYKVIDRIKIKKGFAYYPVNLIEQCYDRKSKKLFEKSLKIQPQCWCKIHVYKPLRLVD